MQQHLNRAGTRCNKLGSPEHYRTFSGRWAKNPSLLLVDPYNDFLSEGGKLSPLLKEIAEEEHLLDHLRQIVTAVRAGRRTDTLVPAPGCELT